jgi:hypothetical protein
MDPVVGEACRRADLARRKEQAGPSAFLDPGKYFMIYLAEPKVPQRSLTLFEGIC